MQNQDKHEDERAAQEHKENVKHLALGGGILLVVLLLGGLLATFTDGTPMGPAVLAAWRVLRAGIGATLVTTVAVLGLVGTIGVATRSKKAYWEIVRSISIPVGLVCFAVLFVTLLNVG